MIRLAHMQLILLLTLVFLSLVLLAGHVKLNRWAEEPEMDAPYSKHAARRNTRSTHHHRTTTRKKTTNHLADFALSSRSSLPASQEDGINCPCKKAGGAAEAPSNPPLRDIHMVMMGDSLMRFQYLSLIYRLRYGVWFDGFMGDIHLVHDKTYENPLHNNTWGEFLYRSNQIFRPYEVCDCFRQSFRGMSEVVENRYYYDPVLNNSIVYILAYGHTFQIKGRLDPRQVRNTTPAWRARAFQQYSELKWQYMDWSDVIRNHVQRLDPQPRHIVLNAGIWDHHFGFEAGTTIPSKHTVSLFRVMNETKDQYEYVFRTTTYSKTRKTNRMRADPYLCDHFPVCVNVSFTRKVRMALYWNKVHFLEPVYRAINEVMLNQLGYLPSGYVTMNISKATILNK